MGSFSTRTPTACTVLACLGLVGVASPAAHAELIYGITGDAGAGNGRSLVRFDSATPGNVTTVGALSGLDPFGAIRAIDFRPATGQLYAYHNRAPDQYTLYTINLSTAAATVVATGTGFNATSRVSIDFDPVTDEIRVLDSFYRNLRINPTTGALTTDDSPYYTGGDRYESSSVDAGGVAYTNNVAGASSSTMYVFDSVRYSLAVATVPSEGKFRTVGAAFPSQPVYGAGNDLDFGFDISGATGNAYLNYNVGPQGETFGRINLATGQFTSIGALPANLLDFSVAIPEPTSLAALGAAAVVGLRRRRRA